MKQTMNWIGVGLTAFVMVDIMIVLFTMLQVAQGGYTPHITFWDEQVRLILKIIH